ncbi:DeoR faimly transcriptional regulator [Pontibacillus halophilus JSM 076056 = DSM 19796]|uniref:DeoR faimly transcriptional regulator n=1 Tax=Pontibacillus halophilus JSM 076056 = DSM 19796 TaxID=1385510 RepID=A0A0A5G829_9BACI|nr:YafY family protein [Pontibacillus halophilus]KGX89296.1 DeoR faimly transcriptional regulator [Pontibacillus halophilus JSM 076056 = DSM 19796]
MAKMDNLLAILWMLRSGNKVTAKDISDKLEMNIRTVYRYVDTLSTSGVPIIAEPGHNGGYSLLNDFIEAPLFFDFEEQASLYHAAVFAEEAGYYGDEALNRAISKLAHYQNQEQQMKVNHHVESLEIISGFSSLSKEPFLRELEQAVADGSAVYIRYYKRNKEESEDRLVDPYRVIYWNKKWYLIGYCHLREDIRSFRINRIQSLTVSEHTFTPPINFSARNYFMRNLLPTMNEEEGVISLVVKGSTRALDDLCQHWFLEHYLQERNSDQAVFLLNQEVLDTYLPYLLFPYGKSIVVIEPTSLKARCVEVLTDLINFYEE